MITSTMLAKTIAIIYTVTGIAVCLDQLDFHKLVHELERSTALTYFAGIIGAVVGFLLTQHHNLWAMHWSLLITLISWGMFVGGLTVVLCPKALSLALKWYKHSPLWGVFMIGFGALFGYLGWFGG
ncbi:MAG TPA: hypothetical protein DCE42_25150 [Myxococcales bacterium]|nr:hypothetical protein [Deltaproteobacteria bacterium]HAA58074.1 hypothetical protein [Myxococcales bacterium]|tara:strand:- start:11871 stop:12248 length:378 start_codon:yes stop_codon:yes gene_type:complete